MYFFIDKIMFNGIETGLFRRFFILFFIVMPQV